MNLPRIYDSAEDLAFEDEENETRQAPVSGVRVFFEGLVKELEEDHARADAKLSLFRVGGRMVAF